MLPLGPTQALYHVDFNLKKEYALWIHELEQAIVVFGMVHILQVLQDPKKELFNDEFVQALIFLLLGFSFYFLIWKKLIKVVYEDEKKEGFRSTFRLFR